MSRVPPVHPIEAEAWKSTFSAPAFIREQLRQTHKLCKEALSSLEDEESQLQPRPQGPQQISPTKANLKARIQRLESSLAPHRLLPPEILSHIFEFAHEGKLCLPEPYSRTCDGSSRPLVKYDPFRIKEVRLCRPGHVCSFWRQVANQTPLLVKGVWEEVEIHYEMIFPEYRSDLEHPSSAIELADVARDIIARGTRTLLIDFGPWWDAEQFYHGWVPDDELLDHTIEEGLSQLEKLIILNSNATQAFLDRCAALCSSFPRLTSVTVQYNLNGQYIFPFHRTNFHNLINLDVGNCQGGIPIVISTYGFYHLLASSPWLKSVNIGICCNDGLPVIQPHPGHILIHKELRDLTFWRADCDCNSSTSFCHQVMAPFQYLSLPSLRKLVSEFADVTKWCGYHSRTLVEFIMRSQCLLEELDTGEGTWMFFPFSTTEWALLSPLLINLKELLVSWALPDEVLEKIAYGEWLPRLYRLMCFCKYIAADGHPYMAQLRELLSLRAKQAGVVLYGGPVELYPLTDVKFAQLQEYCLDG